MKQSCESAYEREPSSIAEKEFKLREAFDESAIVSKYEGKYVSVPFVNQLIDPKLQGYAADMIAYDMHEKIKNGRVDIVNNENEAPTFKVLGIPYSGLFLATAVSERLGWDLVPGRKGPNPPPGAWKDQFIIEEEVKSFTTGEMSSFAFNGITEYDNLLVIDDVVALGYTSKLIIQKLLERGVNVIGLGVYFDKMEQKGIINVEDNTGVCAFSALRIREILKNGLILEEPNFYSEDELTPTP